MKIERRLFYEIFFYVLRNRRVLNLEYNEPLMVRVQGDLDKRKVYFSRETQTLAANPTSDNIPRVLVTPKSTNMQLKSTKGDLVDTKTMETQLSLTNDNSQTSTCSLEDSLAKHFPLLEKELDLTTPEGLSFLKSQGFSSTKDPDIWYSKTSKVYYLTTGAKLSRQYLGFSPTLGISLNGRFLIQKTSVFPKTESGCSLSDILEENVDQKYFLSDKMTTHLLQRVEDKRRQPLLAEH